ncbi:MAG: hypothetical protein NC416_05400, partial [Eubacterium sp.]|nr:hypothetical protein [Eubacterium sp.]
GFSPNKMLMKWHAICKKNGIEYVDFELIRIFCSFIDLELLSSEERKKTINTIINMEMQELALILEINLSEFKEKMNYCIEEEKGQSYLKSITKSIYNNIQYKLKDIVEE